MHESRSTTGKAVSALIGALSLSVLAGVLVVAMMVLTISLAGAMVNTTVSVFDSLPENIAIDQQPQQNRVFATSNGEAVHIATMFDQNREEVTWEQVSGFVKDAAVSGEDRRFYEHGGIDLADIVGAAVTNAIAGGITEGASTITQQYVKNTFRLHWSYRSTSNVLPTTPQLIQHSPAKSKK